MSIDASLKRAVQHPLLPAGDTWRQAYHRYHRFWINLARTVHISEDEAEDLLHSVVITIMEDPGRSFESLEHIRNYVARAVINRAIEFRKNAARHTEWNEAADIETQEREDVPPPELQELRQVLRAGVRGLSPSHFQIVKLRFYAGFTFQEISDMLGLPISTLKSREEAALKKIRKLVRKSGF